jgi:ankyrin repeat protein
MVFLLLSWNANPNSFNAAGDTPLLATIRSNGKDSLIRLLIRQGADIRILDQEGLSSVHLVARTPRNDLSPSVFEILVENDVSAPFEILSSAGLTTAQVKHATLFICFSMKARPNH